MQSLSEYIHDLLAGAEIYSNVTSQLMSWWGSSGRLFVRKAERVATFNVLADFYYFITQDCTMYILNHKYLKFHLAIFSYYLLYEQMN